MTTIHFRHVDGTEETIATAEGESLMRAATHAGVRGIEGECGGEMSCATCHVHIGSPWSEALPPMSADELDILEMTENYTDESRLGCQVPVTSALDGIVATVATTG